MKIRSVTVNSDLSLHERDGISSLLEDSRRSMPFEVETVRVSTVPQNGLHEGKESAIMSAIETEEWAKGSNIDYVGGFGLGRYPRMGDLEFLKWLPEIFDRTERVFSNCQLAWAKTINLEAIRACSRLVKVLSKIDDGFLNLRFGGIYNCEPDNPFFPASYASGEVPNFSISIEGADIAQEAFRSSESLLDARTRFIQLMRDKYCEILSASLDLESSYGIAFYGMDFTMAPTPREEGSIAKALELLGLECFGCSGTLFLSSFLSDCIKSLGGRIGFSGLMYPVLEDGVISKRVAEGQVTIDSLLSYSSVCGTGLDCLPLPGDVSEAALSSIMLDVAGLSCRLEKPLTTRLFPICGRDRGDLTDFSFPYFSNSSVMDVKGSRMKMWKDGEYRFNV